MAVYEIESQNSELMNSTMKRYIQENSFPGIVTAVYHDSEIVHAKAYGSRDPINKVPMVFDEIFNIYSLNKPLFVAAAMVLHDLGKFSLDDSIDKYLPKTAEIPVFLEFKEDKLICEPIDSSITFHNLMTNTAGFGIGFDRNHPVDKLYDEMFDTIMKNNLLRERNLEEIIDMYLDLPLLHQPGITWNYSESMDILAVLIQKISGQPFDEFLQEKILNPLSMTDTGFWVPEHKFSRFGNRYKINQKSEYEKIGNIEDPETKTKIINPPTAPTGIAGVKSTVPDILNFYIMMLNKGNFENQSILSNEAIKLMTDNYIQRDQLPISFGLDLPYADYFLKGYGYGLGGRVKIDTSSQVSIGSYGWSGADTSIAWVDFEKKIVAVFMNRQVSMFQTPLIEDFEKGVYEFV